jgi:RNA polymerase sigma factor (sigma-70 family)
MEDFTDHKIIQGIRNRDDTIFKFLQVRYQDSIRLMVIEMGGNKEDAKDIFNEGLVTLIGLVDHKDFRLTCKLGTLLYALCSKKWKQQMDKQKAAKNYQYRRIDPDPDDDFSEEIDEKLYMSIFWESFQKLDRICKQILEGYLKDLSPREIADVLGYSYGYVRKRKSLCHSFLMKEIENHPDIIKLKETGELVPVQ